MTKWETVSAMFNINTEYCLENTQFLQTNQAGNQTNKQKIGKDINRYWEEVFAVFKINKGLMSRVHQGLLQIKTGKQIEK